MKSENNISFSEVNSDRPATLSAGTIIRRVQFHGGNAAYWNFVYQKLAKPAKLILKSGEHMEGRIFTDFGGHNYELKTENSQRKPE